MSHVDRAALIASLEAEGLFVTEWRDEAGKAYGPHVHEHLEVRVVLDGSMTIEALGQKHVLGAGDRIDIAAGQQHAARVGPDGVVYLAGSSRTTVGPPLGSR